MTGNTFKTTWTAGLQLGLLFIALPGLSGCDWTPTEPHTQKDDGSNLPHSIDIPSSFVSFYGGQVQVPQAPLGEWQWHPLAIGNGGSNTGLQFDPDDPQVIYQTSDVAGIKKTQDGGQHWFSVNNGLQGLANGNYGIGTLAIDPIDSEVLYASISRTWEEPSGIVRSTDAGRSWEWISGQVAVAGEGRMAKKSGANGILIDPANRSRIYAIDSKHNNGAGGIWISEDAGKTWKVSGLDQAQVSGMRFDPQDPKILWASAVNHPDAPGGIYRSLDQGISWQRMGLHAKDVYNFQFDAGDPSILYAVCGTDGVFKTTDAGQDWQSINTGLPLEANGDTGRFYSYLYRALDTDPFKPGHLIVTADVIRAYFESFDGGKTWRRLPIEDRRAPAGWMLNEGHMGWHTNQIYFHPVLPNTLFACDFFGTWRSDDGGRSWEIHPYGAEQSCMVTVLPDIDIPGRYYLGVWDHDLLIYSEHPSNPTTQRTTGARQPSNNTNHHASAVVQDALDPDTLVAVMNSATVVRSEDRGVHWSRAMQGLPEDNFWRLGAPAIAADANLYFLPVNGGPEDGGGVYVSTDQGKTWSRRVNLGLPPIDVTGRYDPRQNVFATNPDGSQLALVSEGKLFRSTDGARSWEAMATPGPATCIEIVDTPSGAEWWVGGEGAAWKSTDSGETWSEVWTGKSQVELIAVENSDTGVSRALIYTVQHNADALGRIGYALLLTEDGGKTWTSLFNPTLAVWRLRSIAFDPFDPDQILASTQWCGTWIAQRPSTPTANRAPTP